MSYPFIPRSVEGFRHVHGRAPTVAELRASIELSTPPTPAPTARSNGCDCYDPECYVCCDDAGTPR